MNKIDHPWWFFSKIVDQSHLTNESSIIDLVSNTSAQQFPDKTLSSVSNFSPEQLNLIFNWRLHFRKNSSHHRTKLSQRENSCLYYKNFQCCEKFSNWNSVITFSLQILLGLLTLAFEGDTITTEAVSQLKCLEQHISWDLFCKWRVWSSIF